MWNQKLKAADQMFASKIALPLNTTTACDTALQTRGHGGRLAVTVDALAPITLPANAMITLTVRHSADDVTYADLVTYTAKYPTVKKFSVGDVLVAMPLTAETDRWVKISIGTTGATGAVPGPVDVFLEYMGG